MAKRKAKVDKSLKLEGLNSSNSFSRCSSISTSVAADMTKQTIEVCIMINVG